ncbi:MAG: GNAT family N-acetyltransferase [Fusobacteriaceae bacterium]
MEFKIVTGQDEKIIEKLVEIEEEVFGKSGGADNWLLKFFSRYGKLFVLIDGDEIISVAEFMQIFGKDEVFLYGFLTVPKFRNKGFAEKILELSEKKLKEFCVNKILLTVDPQNISGINFYKKFGYEILELQKNEYGEKIDRYLMRKKL